MNQDTLKERYEFQIKYNEKENNYSTNKKRSNSLKKGLSKLMALVMGLSVFGFSAGAGSAFFKYKFTEGSNIESNSKGVTYDNNFLSLSQSDSKKYSNTKEVVEDVKDSVVSIIVETEMFSYFSSGPRTNESAGSGIIMKEDDEKIYIATNNHVITGANKVFISVDDYNRVSASFVGSDSTVDLAIISVSKADLKEASINYKVAKFGSEEDIVVGEVAIAMGNALGLGKTATQGIVSAIDKTIEVEGSSLEVIQTDAAINPGNSGGALVNSRGLVIGINTAKLNSTAAEGIGYSIPVTIAVPILEDLIVNGHISKPYMGIEGFAITEEISNRYDLPLYGIYINGVQNGSGASLGGLKQGDVIVEYNGVVIKTMDDLGEMIDSCEVGETVIVKIVRGNRVGELKITLGDLSGESF